MGYDEPAHIHRGVRHFGGITADKERHIRGRGFENRISTGFTDGNVTAITTGVSDGVTGLTGQFILMNLMLNDFIIGVPYGIVAGFTTWPLFSVVTIDITIGIVHAFAIMAGHTVHAALAEVDIAGISSFLPVYSLPTREP